MLTDRILELENISRQLEGTMASRNEWTDKVMHSGLEFLDTLEERKTYFYPEPHQENNASLDPKENGHPLEELLETYRSQIWNRGINAASGGHFGYIPGGGLYPGALGDYLAAAGNTYAGIAYASPGGAKMEEALIRWMNSIIGWGDASGGTLTSGGSLATLTALIVARDQYISHPRQLEQACIYLTDQAHHCIRKAVHLAGMHFAQIRSIAMHGDYTMDTEDLQRQLEKDRNQGLLPLMIVGSAGTTDTGVIDPLDKIAALSREFGTWFHVDAAYGGFFALVPELKPKFKGWEQADSVVIDPHKGLFLPYGIGAVLIRDRKKLFQSMRYSAAYMQDADVENLEYSPSDYSPELTRHFRSVRMWMPLRLFGVAPIRAAIEEKYLLTKYLYNALKELGWHMGPAPTLTVFLFRAGTDTATNEFNRRIATNIHRDGSLFISTTSLEGVFWLRIAVLSFRTHLAQADQLIRLIDSSRQAAIA
ncbi:MAG: aminotransferase class V-fold PLP-dependent enzyme [Saprospiraceae bacterium]|nr:aminotransferase class V-fold PLP-dependent enzyme [Saprospiraceae bacterium]MCB9318979.1 aminotransferase class V-fold PLP-dependent enzyme [Lewinellaceae bacterium]